jgi:hypothetical protein
MFIGGGGLQAEIYTPSTNTWSSTKPVAGNLPFPLTSAATGADGRIYTFSAGDGCCNNGDAGGGGFVYTPSTNAWQALPVLNALPGSLWWGSWADGRRDARGRIVLVGGWGACAAGGCGQPYGSLSIFDPATQQWSFGFDAPAEAQMPATVMVGTTLYSIGGGLSEPGQATNEVDVLPLADTMPPTIQAPPSITVSPTGTLYTTSVPIHVVNHAIDPSGIAGAHLQRSANGSPFTDGLYPWSPSDTTIRPGVPYVFREQYVDGAGNLSAWATAPSFRASVFEEGYSGVKYTGTWMRGSLAGSLGGSTKWTTSPGASATLGFTGRSVRFVGASTPQSGFAEIIVDGVLQGIYNFTPGAANSVGLTYSWPSSGKHSMQMVDVKGGPGLRVDVDAFVVLS